MTVNVSKHKIMRTNSKNEGDASVTMADTRMEVVDSYQYLGVIISKDGEMNEDVKNGIREARKVARALQKVWKKKKIITGSKS